MAFDFNVTSKSSASENTGNTPISDPKSKSNWLGHKVTSFFSRIDAQIEKFFHGSILKKLN